MESSLAESLHQQAALAKPLAVGIHDSVFIVAIRQFWPRRSVAGLSKEYEEARDSRCFFLRLCSCPLQGRARFREAKTAAVWPLTWRKQPCLDHPWLRRMRFWLTPSTP